MDVIVEFIGNDRKDDIFNLLHEDDFTIGGINVDINLNLNTITEGKVVTLDTYLPEVDQYLTEK